jgi:hypothetical protein
MENWNVTLKGHMDVPIEEHSTGEILFTFTCVVEGSSLWEAMSDAADKLNNAFNKGVGFISPTIEEMHVEPHYE